MALEGKGRFLQSEGSRSLIYISQKVAQDSTFPFGPGDELIVRIDPGHNRIIVEKRVGPA